MFSTLSMSSIVATLVSIGGLAFNSIRKKYLKEMTLPDGSPTIDESVTRPMLSMAQTCARLCRAIYDRREDLGRHLQIDGWKFDRIITSNNFGTVCGVVYRDDGPAPSAIIVWRGTNLLNRVQVYANRKVKQVACWLRFPVPGTMLTKWVDSEIPGLVHQGLAEQYQDVHNDLINVVRWHFQRGRKIYVTGHSQGGGLAALTVAAMKIYAETVNIDASPASGLITFGSLRPGDQEFASCVLSAVPNNPDSGEFGIMRFRNNNDIVSLVPPFTSGYQHPCEELYIWPGSMITRNPGWPLKLVQRIKPMMAGVIGDGFADHSIDEYCRHLDTVRIQNEREPDEKLRAHA